MKAHIQTAPDTGVVQSSLPLSSKTKSGPEKYLPEINIVVGTLPSKGLAYPEVCEVKYRPYVWGEIKKINQSNLRGKDKFEMVLSGVECSFDKYDLTVSDVLYLSFLRKISTLGGSKIILPINCSACNKEIRHIIEIGTSKSILEFNDISAPELPIEVTFSNNEVFVFNPLTVKKLYEMIDKKVDVYDDIPYMASQCIDHSYEDSYNFLSNILNIEDLEIVETLDAYLNHGIKPIKVKCTNAPCTNEIKVELDGGEALLLPFRESSKPVNNRFYFGERTRNITNRPK